MSEIDMLVLEALKELEEDFNAEVRQPGDLSIEDVADHMGCAWTTAVKFMRNMVKEGKYEEHRVRADTGHKIVVFRKVYNKDPLIVKGNKHEETR